MTMVSGTDPRRAPTRMPRCSGSTVLPVPSITMNDVGEGTPVLPTHSFEVRRRLQMADGPDAQPSHRDDALRDAEEVAQEALAVEGHPSHADALGRAGQPQVLDGQTYRVDPRSADGVAAQHVRPPTVGVISDDDGEGGLQDALDLDAGESLGPLVLQPLREHLSLLLDVVPEGPADALVVDQDEVPRL